MTAAFTRAELTALGYVERAEGHWEKVGDAGGSGAAKSATSEATAPRSPFKSKWEQDRAAYHEIRRRGGLIRHWLYEPIRLKLADGAWYKIDFMIWHNDGLIELEEVKGHWREAARVRFKIAVSQYPMFAFTVVTKQKGHWHTLEERCGGWLDIVSPGGLWVDAMEGRKL